MYIGVMSGRIIIIVATIVVIKFFGILYKVKSEATSSHPIHNVSESDNDPTDLGYFEPADSDDSDDSAQQHEVEK
jgi:hypothetical protein